MWKVNINLTHQIFFFELYWLILYYQIKTEMEKIEVTLQEIRMATRPNVYRNRKKYTRKRKHKNQKNDQ